ncbi:hypothetical protein SAMN04487912_105204 [Arthrobacter sp. cf158]|nr:hypothetical protein SAMN04487912_105204 [Arthrobacter sp. cf158]
MNTHHPPPKAPEKPVDRSKISNHATRETKNDDELAEVHRKADEPHTTLKRRTKGSPTEHRSTHPHIAQALRTNPRPTSSNGTAHTPKNDEANKTSTNGRPEGEAAATNTAMQTHKQGPTQRRRHRLNSANSPHQASSTDTTNTDPGMQKHKHMKDALTQHPRNSHTKDRTRRRKQAPGNLTHTETPPHKRQRHHHNKPDKSQHKQRHTNQSNEQGRPRQHPQPETNHRQNQRTQQSLEVPNNK